jgi:hypothetical protein
MSENDRPTFDIAVPSVDPEKKDGDKPQTKEAGKAGEKETKEESDIVSTSWRQLRWQGYESSAWLGDGSHRSEADDQSEEDLQLKSELEMLVERLKVSSKLELGCGLSLTGRNPTLIFTSPRWRVYEHSYELPPAQ